jgi:hypothetical protein
LAVVPSQTNIPCFGGTGTAQVSVSGGMGGYTYAWSPVGGNAATSTPLIAGSYSCTATDIYGCSITQSFLITEASALSVSTTQNNPLCNGTMTGDATVSVTGGTPSYTYAWSSGGIAATESGLGAGTYTCTITDASGCSTTSTVNITEPSAISITGGIVSTSCFGTADGAINIMTSGGTPGYTWIWSHGATTESIANLTDGLYCVTVTDVNGCTFTTCLTVTSPPLLTTAGVVTDASSCTSNDGAVDLTVTGGTAAYTFAWSNTATTEDVTGLDGGIYSVTTTDANGCTTTATFTITEPSAPVVTYSEPVDTTCDTQAPWSLSFGSPAGGTWSGPGVSGNTFDPVVAPIGFNVITYTYTDVVGCTGFAMDSIWNDLCLDANTIAETNFSLYPNPTSGNLSIVTNGDIATIIVLDALGQQVMSLVSNSATIEIDLSGNSNGLYFLRIEQNGNSTMQRVILNK